jgi:hypothetical protein
MDRRLELKDAADILLIWSGSSVELCRFRAVFEAANINIKLEWQGMPTDVDAADPATLVQHQLRRVNFLDLDIQYVRSHGSAAFAFKIYRKPGNAYAYLPMDPTTRDTFSRLAQGRDATTANAL